MAFGMPSTQTMVKLYNRCKKLKFLCFQGNRKMSFSVATFNVHQWTDAQGKDNVDRIVALVEASKNVKLKPESDLATT